LEEPISLAISARALEKSYGSVQALRGVDLDVPRGAAFGFIGENGAGKTTLIKLLLGVARPDSGEVRVFGGSPDDVHIRRRLGYLPERLVLPAAFTPLRFLRGVGRIKGLSPKTLNNQVPRVLMQVGLDEAAWTRKTRGFSKGMRQRTGLAAALLGDPELLVLDEPTDGIDPVGRARIRQVIEEATKAGATVFLNSHLLAETEKICDHVAIITKGKVVTSGAMDALRSLDAYRVRFAEADNVDARAAAAGFEPDTELRASGDRSSFRIVGADPEALSAALARALAAGLLVVEVQRALKDLETVLREAIERGS